MPVASGGLHPGLVPKLINIFGNDFVIQMGGGIHGHPDGTAQGATAARQAVDAILGGLTLKKYAEDHPELARAISKWRESPVV
jgi:ribulose-bisphosphate carboxylase large chain